VAGTETVAVTVIAPELAAAVTVPAPAAAPAAEPATVTAPVPVLQPSTLRLGWRSPNGRTVSREVGADILVDGIQRRAGSFIGGMVERHSWIFAYGVEKLTAFVVVRGTVAASLHGCADDVAACDGA